MLDELVEYNQTGVAMLLSEHSRFIALENRAEFFGDEECRRVGCGIHVVLTWGEGGGGRGPVPGWATSDW